MATGSFTAVLDRFEGDLAVLLLEDDGETVDELVVEERRLPDDGRHEGSVFDVEVEGGHLKRASYRPEETRRRRESVRERFDRLADRLPDEDDR